MSDQYHPLRAGLKDDKLFSFHFWGVMLPHNTISLVNWVLKHCRQRMQINNTISRSTSFLVNPSQINNQRCPL